MAHVSDKRTAMKSEQLLGPLSQASGAGASASVTTVLVAFGANLPISVHVLKTNCVIATYSSDAEPTPTIPFGQFLGKDLADFVKRIASPERYLVVLSPALSASEWREEQRLKGGFVHLSADALDDVLRRETAHIGYWLDCSTQTPDETVADILANLDKAAV